MRTLPDELVITFYKLRTSNHPLEVESKRYIRPLIPRFMRKCTHCNLNETGNEYHFLLVCPLFNDLRTKYIPLKYRNRVNSIKVLDLLSSKDKQVMLNLSKYIKESLKLNVIV